MSASGALAAWGLPVLVALWAVGMPFYFQEAGALLGAGVRTGTSYRLATLANTLLAASTALHLASLWFCSDLTRRLAAWLAGSGAGCLALDILFRSAAAGIDGRALISVETVAYQLAALLVAVTVVGLLTAERTLRSTTAGAFIMPLVMGGVVTQIWLINHGAATPGFAVFAGLRAYWGQAYLVAQVIGYGAFLGAALLGILYLARYAAEELGMEERSALRALPGLWRLYSMMASAIAAGFPVFALAALMIVAWTVDGGAWDWASLARLAWVAGVVVLYGFLAGLLVWRAPSGPRLAVLSVLGFGVTLLGFVLLHAAGAGPEAVAGLTRGSMSGSAGCA